MTGLWFKRRRFGWGWTPASKEGWLTLGVFVAAVFAGAGVLVLTTDDGDVWPVVAYLVFVAIAVVALIRVAMDHGPTPRWRWGRKDGDDPKSDF